MTKDSLDNANLIIIESSFSVSSVGLYQNQTIEILEGKINEKHSSYLLHHVHHLLEKNNYSIEQEKKLKAIICSKGPGSFTALRVGVSIAKALSFSWNLPIIPICSLKAIAKSTLTGLKEKNIQDRVIIVLMDARVRGIYAASYQIKNNNELTEFTKKELIDVDHLSDYLQHLTHQLEKKFIVCGNIMEVYKQEFYQSIGKAKKDGGMGGQKINQVFFIKRANIGAMIELAKTTHENQWLDAKEFEINYIRNDIADKPKKIVRN